MVSSKWKFQLNSRHNNLLQVNFSAIARYKLKGDIMKKVSVLQSLIAGFLMLVVHTSAFAHSALSVSSPENGQTVSAPSVLMLGFNGDVRLVRLTMATDDGPVEIGFTPQAEAMGMFHVPMPALAAGTYRVEWTILGADGHSVSENFRFTVDPSAPAAVMNHDAMHVHMHDDEAESKPEEMEHHQH